MISLIVHVKARGGRSLSAIMHHPLRTYAGNGGPANRAGVHDMTRFGDPLRILIVRCAVSPSSLSPPLSMRYTTVNGWMDGAMGTLSKHFHKYSNFG